MTNPESSGCTDALLRATNPMDRAPGRWSAAAIYTVAITLPNVMPALVGIFADNLHFNGQQLGAVAAAYPLGVGIVASSSYVWIRRVNWRLCIVFGVVVLAGAVGLQKLCTDFAQVLTLMFVAGLGGGLAASPSLTALGDGTDPRRNFGVMIAVSVILPAVVLALVDPINSCVGYGGVFIFLAVLLLLSAPLVLLLPKHGRVSPSRTPVGEAVLARMTRPLLHSLLSMVPFVAGYVSAWIFFERIGARSALPHDWILNALAVGGLVGGLGGFAAVWMSRVWQPRTSLLAAIGATVLTLALLAILKLSPVSYLLLAGSFQLWINVNFSNIMTFIATEDEAGYSVGLIPALQCFGAAVGSVVAGGAFDRAGQHGVVGVAITAFLICSGLMITAFRLGHDRPLLEAR
jgi:predicted MFS family arabinose efflux permease